MIFDSLLGMFSVDMGIDLGTCNTLVCIKGEGINSEGAQEPPAAAGIRQASVEAPDVPGPVLAPAP